MGVGDVSLTFRPIFPVLRLCLAKVQAHFDAAPVASTVLVLCVHICRVFSGSVDRAVDCCALERLVAFCHIPFALIIIPQLQFISYRFQAIES